MTNKTKSERELERTIKQLEEYTGRGTQLVSIYIPPDDSISDIISHIKQEYSEAGNIKQKQTRKNVQSALSSIESRLKYYETIPENGLAVFSGVIDEENNEQETIVIESIPNKISSYTYHCDNEFLIEPLKEQIDTGSVYGLLVLDRRNAQLGKLVGGSIRHIDSMESGVMGKHKAGGQSQKRFERLIEESIQSFFSDIRERVNAEFVEQRHQIEGILVGGPSPTKEEFLNSGDFHHEIPILGTFDVGDTTERGVVQLVEEASDVISENELVQQREIMDRFLKSLKKDEGKVTYGKTDVIDALRLGAVETILISDSLEDEVVIVGESDNSHQCISLDDNTTCYVCGSEVSKEEGVYFVDWLENLASERGSDIIVVSDSFEEGQQLKSVFGSLAALLRFNPC